MDVDPIDDGPSIHMPVIVNDNSSMVQQPSSPPPPPISVLLTQQQQPPVYGNANLLRKSALPSQQTPPPPPVVVVVVLSEEEARLCIEMLRSEDLANRVAAANRLDAVATSLGQERTRDVRGILYIYIFFFVRVCVYFCAYVAPTEIDIMLSVR